MTNELFITPQETVNVLMEELVKYLPSNPKVIDAGSGTGSLAWVVKEYLPESHITAIEIDSNLIPHLNSMQNIDRVVEADFLNLSTNTYYDLIISNPPFTKAQEFVSTCLKYDRNIVAVLLRLNFLASQRRHNWWSNMLEAPKIRVLSQRPSFRYGRTDATEYGWFIWGLDEKVVSLSWYL